MIRFARRCFPPIYDSGPTISLFVKPGPAMNVGLRLRPIRSVISAYRVGRKIKGAKSCAGRKDVMDSRSDSAVIASPVGTNTSEIPQILDLSLQACRGRQSRP